MTTISVNGSLTLDQSSGAQSGSDGDDIAIAADLSGLPEQFRTFLLGLSSTFLTLDGFLYADDVEAASSAGGDPLITVDPGEAEIDKLYFSKSDGTDLDGDQVFLDDGVTAMQTIDGEDIFLHSYEDGQIVLATTSATRDAGEVVAAFYLEPSADLLSAEVTMVTFKAIDHPIGGDNDDSVNFGDLLNVSANGSLSFDFDGLDSGNFLHVSVGGEGAALLVSGRDIAVDSDGDIIKGGPNKSDTINTSQGGEGSTIGLNSQMFSPGSTAVFSLVEGENVGTSTNINDIDYTDFIDVTEVGIFLSQFQGSALVSMRVSAFSAGGINTDAETGESYIYTDTVNATGDALGDDDEITIVDVKVFDENENEIVDLAGNGITITFDPDGTGDAHVIQVDGLQVLWTVNVFTTDTFNRFHIESMSGDFDIGRIDLADQGLTVTTPIGDALAIDDDGPIVDLAVATGVAVIVDETLGDGDENLSPFLAQVSITAAGYLSTNTANAGTDGAASDVFAFVDPGTDAPSGLIDTLSGDAVVLNLVGGDIVGRTAGGGEEVMRFEIDATTGEVTLSLKRAIVHDDAPDDHDENDDPEMLAGSGLIVVARTVVDNDGDSASDIADLTALFKFEDDGPTAALVAQAASFVIDETDGAELAPGEVDPAGGDLGSVTITGANLFTETSVFGTDGQAASDATVYDLVLSGADAVSGLTDTASGEVVVLNLVGGDIVGTTAEGGDEVLRISIDAETGDTTVTLSRAVVHGNTADPDEEATPKTLNTSTVFVRVTVTDGDGDQDSSQFDLGALVALEDDGPSVSPTVNALPSLVTDDTDITDTASASFAAVFSYAFGSDGFKDAGDDDVEDADAVAYTLGIKAPDVDSGIDDTLSGDNVLLRLDGGTIEGYLESAPDTLAFTIAVDAATGEVTLTQLRSVVHDNAGDPDETGAEASVLDSADLVTLTATATDGDGDQASATIEIGDAFAIEDDGPSIERTLAAIPTLTTDDTDISDANSADFSALFTHAFGSDGFKDADDDDAEDADSVAYTLDIKEADIDSGLDDSQSGDDILLRLNSGVIEGYLENDSGTLAFTIDVNADSGSVELTQLRAILHDNVDDPAETGAEAEQLDAADLIRLTVTITDGDGDKASAFADIGLAFHFEDDGPGMGPIGDFVVDYTVEPEGAGSTSLNMTISNDLDPDIRITGFKGDGLLPVVVNGIALTAELSADGTQVLYYQDLGAPGAFDGGIEDLLYYSYTLVDTDVDGFVDTAQFTVHAAPSAGNLVFDLSELPSGQNLFGVLAGKAEGETAVNPDGPSLIVIGRDNSLDPDGTYDSISDTVNTSQGGGPTTIGNSNQMIDAGEGLFFAYVNDPNDDFVSAYSDEFVDGLDQSEADDADNIQYFGGVLKVEGAAFQIAQTQGNEDPALRITAYDGTGTGADGSGLQMRDFALDPVAGATQVDVIAVRVYDENGNLIEDTSDLGNFDDSDIQVNLNPGSDPMSALVSGLKEKYWVEFVTDEPHDISLIEGTLGKFDIGGFQLLEAIPTPDQIFNFELEHTDSDGDSVTAAHSVRIDGTGVFNDDPLPIGTEGNDTIVGTPGDEIMLGLGGHDLLIPDAGYDVVDGGDGNDVVDYSTSDAGIEVTLGGTVDGGHATGDTLISIEGVIGTEFVDTLTGDASANLIEGRGSGDFLDGGDGKDILSYAGSDSGVNVVLNGAASGGHADGDVIANFEDLLGSNFDDVLVGDGGANAIIGGKGDDRIAGLGGADLLVGSFGSDIADYSASAAAVTVTLNDLGVGTGVGGDAQGDQLIAIENIIGSAFDDTLVGDSRNNVIAGGAGADQLTGGTGIDTADYSTSSAGVTVALNGIAMGGDAEGDALSGFENLTGSAFDDTLTGDGFANTLNGDGGDDVIDGGVGHDVIDGGDGNDELSGGTFNDVITGGNGFDTIFGGDGNDILTGGLGDDVIHGDANNDTISGGEGNDTLFGGLNDDSISGDGGDDVIFGGSLSDTIDGGTGNDVISGGNLNDVISGGADNDTINGDEGDDILNGDGGDDVIDGGVGHDVIDGGDGNDELSGGTFNDVIAGGNGFDTIFGGDGNDILTGGLGDDVIHGDANNDTIDGGDGNDVLFGGGHNDEIFGGAGNDSLFGGNLADILHGGAGDDQLSGGIVTGDVFVFADGDGTDTIIDWKDGLDAIDLGALALSGFGDLTVGTYVDGTEITMSGSTTVIRLEGVLVGAVDDTDFVF